MFLRDARLAATSASGLLRYAATIVIKSLRETGLSLSPRQ